MSSKIEREIFGIICAKCTLPEPTRYDHKSIHDLARRLNRCVSILRMDDIERLRMGSTKIFHQPDSGWIRLAGFT